MIQHYESQSEDEAVLEDEAAFAVDETLAATDAPVRPASFVMFRLSCSMVVKKARKAPNLSAPQA